MRKNFKTRNIIAIIPVAGVGSRLRPHTHTQPKALIPVAGKPILAHIVDNLMELGIVEFVFVIGYLGDKIKQFIEMSYPDNINHFVFQEEMKGSGHAVSLAKKFVNKPTLIIYGDTIIKGDISHGIESELDANLGVTVVDDPRRFGIVEKNEDGIVNNLIEKPDFVRKSEVLVGVSFIRNYKLLFDCLDEIIRKNMKTKGEFYLTDGFGMMVKKGAKITTFPVEGWLDCGKIDTLLETNAYLLKNMSSTDDPVIKGNSIIIPPAYISPSAKLSNSIVGPNVSIGNDCVIENSIMSNSIISNNTSILSSHLASSVIGQEVEVSGKANKLNIGDHSSFGFEE